MRNMSFERPIKVGHLGETSAADRHATDRLHIKKLGLIGLILKYHLRPTTLACVYSLQLYLRVN